MGLTRIRAEQISDIDYKQAVRAILLSNVTLAGGAPAIVDGVSLAVNDRILVNGQTTGSQNGIYQVQTVGTGSNGTWIRSTDTNATGELEAGTIVMVTEGTTYADTQWKLTTNNPIIIGTTPLTFVINILSQLGGANTQIQYNNAGAMGASANLTWDGTTLYVNGTTSVTGNITGNYFLGNGSQLTGIDATSIQNGTSNVKALASANVTIGVAGTSNVAVFSPTGIVTGNITGGNLLINTDAIITGNLTVNGTTTTINSNTITTNDLAITLGNNQNTGSALNGAGIDIGNNSLATWKFNNATTSWQSNIAVMPTANGTLTLGGTSNYWGAAYVTSMNVTGNVTGSYFFGNGSQLTGIDATAIQNGTSNVRVAASGNVTVSSAGTPNVLTVTGTGANIAGTLNATGNANVANLGTNGNITAGYFLGNGSQLTGIDATAIQNGTANVRTFLNGNVTVSAAGTANVVVVTSTGANIAGTLNTGTGNISAGNLSVSAGAVTLGSIVNANANGIGNIGSASLYFNTVFAKATSAQYADLAENYVADKDYPVGTVLRFGGSHEVTESDSYHDARIAGTVSENPAYLMNSGLSTEHTVAVALLGRVPCRVVGTISKGDRLVASEIRGVATALDPESYQPGCIIGKALEEYTNDEPGVIEIVVGRL
jgi:hypothetical protein